MPGLAMHSALCRKLRRVWPAPYAVDLTSHQGFAALLAGAVAPDSGYYPGGSTSISDLSHHVHPGSTARRLLESAKNGHQRAFAYGWLTHVLLDQAVHPWINRRVGVLQGRPGTEVPYEQERELHLGVEVGLDAALSAADKGVPACIIDGVAAIDVDWLRDGLDRAYPDAIERDGVERSARAMRRGLPWLRRYTHFLRDRAVTSERRSCLADRVFTALAGFAGSFAGSPGWLRPIPASRAAARSMMRRLGVLAARFERLHAGGFVGLPDADLDTGRVESR